MNLHRPIKFELDLLRHQNGGGGMSIQCCNQINRPVWDHLFYGMRRDLILTIGNSVEVPLYAELTGIEWIK